MENMPDILWGVHMPREAGDAPLRDGYIAIGWDAMGDLAHLAPNREAYKRAYAETYPDQPPGAVPVSAGVLYRFAVDMKPGDGVIYPSKTDRMVNLGIVEGDYEHRPGSILNEHANTRAVRWVRHVPRAEFSQAALNEIGSALTLFQVANNAEEFLEAFAGEIPPTAPPDDATAEAVSEQVAENTDDYVTKRLKTGMTDYEFEEFVAGLLRAMGYRARVTRKTGDGGVDVIAHRDELGFEPPIIKVQCKQTLATIGRPDIQRLHGAIEPGEFGLFVTLGGYSSDALTYEQTKANLRLIDGQELANLIYRSYERFTPAMQRRIPLRRIYVPGPEGED